MIDLEPSALDELARFTRAAESIGFELNQRSEGEGVVTRDEVHVAVRDSRHAERAFPSIVACDVMQHRPRVIPLRTLSHRARVSSHDEDGRMTQIVCTL